MGEMIERAAEDLYLHDAKSSSIRWVSWKTASVRKQQAYRDRVDTVLVSLREPTRPMAGLLSRYDSHDMGVRNYQAAIDKARADG